MTDLVLVKSNAAVTTSLIIAEGTGLKPKSIIRTIKAKQKRLEKFGKLHFSDFKSLKSKGRPQKICYLNEMQATLLMTYLDNSEVVDDFKEELVRQFYTMESVLRERKTAEWLTARKTGIIARKSETDVIKQLVEYAKAQGSEHSNMLYVTYSRLANSMAGIKNRDVANAVQLNLLMQIEHIILKVIRMGIDAKKHYKEIYRDCKERLSAWLQLGMIDVGQLAMLEA